MKEQHINPWKTLSSENIYANPWISLTEHQVVNPGGRKGIYGESNPEESEKLIIRKLPFAAAYEMVLSGEITDSLSVAAILKVKILKFKFKEYLFLA